MLKTIVTCGMDAGWVFLMLSGRPRRAQPRSVLVLYEIRAAAVHLRNVGRSANSARAGGRWGEGCGMRPRQ